MPDMLCAMGDKSKNAALNVVRALAALLVVITHVRGWILIPLEQAGSGVPVKALYALTGLGHGAVLVFFVLSGYFVGASVVRAFRGGYFSWRVYAVSRLTRLWIVLAPALVVTLAMDAVGRTYFSASDRFGPQSEAVLHTSPLAAIGNLFFLQPTYVPTLGSNGALWSLTFEFAYYTIFPIVMLGVLRGSGWQRYASVTLTIALCIFFGFQVIVLFSAWLLGALLAAQQHRIISIVAAWRSGTRVTTRVAAGVVLIATMVADRISGGSPEHSPPATFAVALAAAVFVGLMLPDPKPSGVLGRFAVGAFSGLAESSYSLYAMHLPVLTLLAVAISRNGATSTWEPTLLNWVILAFIVALLVTAGWGFSQLTERHTAKLTRWILARTGIQHEKVGRNLVSR
ncbi:acyltransferase family protein [Arthrobacter sp. FW306-04-A]|uniref:acyltransferase family protein n=1 Tax=Arthrobacter sp. FW306-04-A TaxID=2879619 RepID=UPI0037BF20E6|nr:acyltransferase [Arthrobacter sp. FW306-04-A]